MTWLESPRQHEVVPMTDEFLDQLLVSMGRYLAGLLSTRCTAFVERGNFRSLLKYESKFDPSQPQCRSCGTSVKKQVLCDECRRVRSVVRYGPTIVDSMYRSSNPAYEIDEEKKLCILKLRNDMCLSCDVIVLTRAIAQLCWAVHSSYVPNTDTRLLNVLFDRDLVCNEGNYRQPISCGTAFHVPVGGFGIIVRDRIRELALEWLKHMDQTIRAWFAIPVGRTDESSASVDGCARQMSRLVAERVSLMDSPGFDQADRCLSVEACNHIAALQHLRCRYHASAVARSDVVALRALVGMAQAERQDLVLLLTTHRLELVRILETPPPELLKALPSVVSGYRLDELRDVIGNKHEHTIHVMADATIAWRETINTSTLCIFLQKAQNAANVWSMSGNLLRVIFADDDVASGEPEPGKPTRASLCNPAARLPSMGWVLDDREWFLIPKQRHAARRTGLDPAGLRIVLMCSVVHRLLTDGSRLSNDGLTTMTVPSVFSPGCVSASILSPLANAALQRSLHAYGQLKEQLRPLTVGIEWAHAQTEIGNWSGSHIDNDVREAARHLSKYSVLQLEQHFGQGGHKLIPRLLETVRDMLVVKPRGGYTDFVSVALKFALPILREYRHSIGFAVTSIANPVGDMLRLLPSVREWKPTHGELRLRASDLRGMPPIVKNMIDQLVKERRLVQRRRPTGATCFLYCFSESELGAVLAPDDTTDRVEEIYTS